jgi:hypothetical protein
MQGPIYRFLADDHDRLDGLFRKASTDRENIDMNAFAQFRSGLLHHIRMEETVLLRQLKEVPEVPLHPHNPKPEILEATRRAVERAGYSMKPG